MTSDPQNPQHRAEEILKKLREPFPTEQIFALPRITCPECSRDSHRVCADHRKAKCKTCGSYITTAHLDLDYVGHAELTNRLLDADPTWSWEPMGLDAQGLPAFDKFGGLWIRLTIGGHTRPGYGDSQGKTGPNAVKEAIGDALRNAAMRFGAALDLWAKSDLHAAQSEHPRSESEEAAARVSGEERKARELAEARAREQARDRLLKTGARKGLDADGVIAWCQQQYNAHPKTASVQDLVIAESELAKSMPDKQQSTPRPHGSQNHPAGKRRPAQSQAKPDPGQKGGQGKAPGGKIPPQRPGDDADWGRYTGD